MTGYICSSFFLGQSRILKNSSSLQRFFLSSSAAASVVARGSYIEVKTDMRKMLYEVPRRVLPKPSDAPVILIISR